MFGTVGMNWYSFYHIWDFFKDVFSNYDSSGFTWFHNYAHDWTHTLTYGNEITKVAYAVSACMGGLPLPIVYLMSLGFGCTICLVVLKIVIDLF